MIGEILPDIYDVCGRPVAAPVSRKRNRLFHGTYPIPRHLSSPLSVRCATLAVGARPGIFVGKSCGGGCQRGGLWYDEALTTCS